MLQYCGLWCSIVCYGNFEGKPYNVPEYGEKCASKMYVQNYTTYHLEDPNHDFSVR